MTFVVDASFAASWCFDDEATVSTDVWFRRATDRGFVVPSLWIYEVAKLMRMAEKRGRITIVESKDRLDVLRSLVIHGDETQIGRTWDAVLDIARAHDLTAYDAAYVELALRMEYPLATRDKAMISAARKFGIKVIEA